jgi:plasmid stabilization system protein ParE
MHRIRFSVAALGDLESIQTYIRADNPQAADSVRHRIIECIEMLATQPNLGRPGRVPGTRELVIAGTPFIAPYWLPRPNEIEILAVIHGARRWPP